MIDWLSGLPTWIVVLAIGASILVESGFLFGLVLPGTTAVIAMGVMVGLGIAPPFVAYGVAVTAAVAGPSIGWRIGRIGGPALRTSSMGRRIPAVVWEKADSVIESRGRSAVAFAQFVVGARTLVPLLVGMSGAPYSRFAVISIPAAGVWAIVLAAAGQLAGASYHVLTRALGNGTVAIAVVAVVILGLGMTGRVVAGQPQWGLHHVGADASAQQHQLHSAVDRVVTALVGERLAFRATALLWWLVAVLAGLGTCAAMVWAVERSNLDAVDQISAAWISEHTSGISVTAAKIVDVALDPTAVLVVTYLLTLVFLIRHRTEADRARRTRAVTISLGLAALALSSDWVAGFVRNRSATDDSSTHFFDLQVAIVPCALAIAAVIVTSGMRRALRVSVWSVVVVLTGCLVASKLVLATMNLSEVVASLIVAAAWTVLLINVTRQPETVSLTVPAGVQEEIR